MKRYYLGVDIGGSKSHALIADGAGQVVGFGEGGPGNPSLIGYDGLAALLRSIVGKAMTPGSIGVGEISGAGFGIAGYDWPAEQRESMLQAVGRLELEAPLEIVNDAIIGMLAGAAEGWGVGVVAGTSCNCWGWDKDRREGRMTGYGSEMGEGVGGWELVAEAVKAIAREWTMRGPPTRLSAAFVDLFGARDVEDLLEGLTLERYHALPIAAPTVFRAAAEGDSVAQELILWAGRELGSMAVGVIRQLGFEDMDFDVVMAGSFYDGSPLLEQVMRETIHPVAPGARLVRLHGPPVVGGVLLGMEQAGADYLAVRKVLLEQAVGISKS